MHAPYSDPDSNNKLRDTQREREIVKQGGGKKKEWKMEDQKGKPKEKI